MIMYELCKNEYKNMKINETIINSYIEYILSICKCSVGCMQYTNVISHAQISCKCHAHLNAIILFSAN